MNNLSIRKMNELSKKKKKGFTLIELIIVIAIIAILAAVAIPKFGQVRQNANVASDIANAKNISLAVSKAIADNQITIPVNTAATLDSIGTEKYNITTDLDGITGSTKLKTKGHTDDVFEVTISDTGNVRVLAGEKEVYPVPDATDFATK